MSTSKRAKEQRMKQQAKERRERELAAKGISLTNSKLNRKFRPMAPKSSAYRRDDGQDKIKSLNSSEFNTARKESQQYTGTLVKGIMESHKSNLLPVVDKEHIVAITKMRRN